MVRAGGANHPSAWAFSGYHEIEKPRRKGALVAYDKLQKPSGFSGYDRLRAAHREWKNRDDHKIITC
jgi:REP-associated tyrosine transposase